MGTEGVADRSAHASYVVGIELGIVVDPIEVCLGADEKAAPEVVTHATACVHQQMVAAHVEDTTRRIIATTVRIVETQAFAADSGHELRGNFVSEAGRKYGVEVVQDRTEGLVVVIEALFGADCDFSAEAEAVLENDVGAEAGVHSSLLRGGQISLRGAGVFGGQNGAVANGNVNLLSAGETGE